MPYAAKFTIEPVAPFSLDLSAQIFVGGDYHLRNYSNGVFQQVLRVSNELVLAKLTSHGTIDDPQLTVELISNTQLATWTKKEAEKTLRKIFNLDFELRNFYREVKNDQTMHRITQQLYGYKFPTTPTVFESLVDAIVEQQISIKVARTIEERIAKKFGDKIEIDGDCYYVFPTAKNMMGASTSDIQQVGLSKRKAEYIYNAAKFIVNGELDLEEMSVETDVDRVVSMLDEVKGIGVWTAELTMLRGMQRWDVLPADDFGIRRVISAYYCGGKPIKAPEAREIAKVWGKWKGLAAFYLIVAEVKAIAV
ncbi:MAG: DNA-3-methyladenine glycosylase family protein [Betaproteobacteria bacterium]